MLVQSWARRGWLAWSLWPVSLLFRALTSIRRALYSVGWLKTKRLPVPVIVVGNIFIGGTGKTPFTIWLVQALRQAGYVPGVISRGYGVEGTAPLVVNADSLPQQVGDEPVLIAQRARCPLVVGRDRVAAARALLAANQRVNVIISDDGLQHYAMGRDIEIVLFDGRGVGNGWTLPAGPLREPASRRRDFTVLHAAHDVPGMPSDAIRMRLVGDVAERLTDGNRRIPLASLNMELAAGGLPPRVAAAAGIGNPGRFFGMLRAAGLVVEELPLPDHYDFSDNPFAQVTADIVLITEKDAVKCRQVEAIRNDPRLWVVPVAADIDGVLAKKILEKLRGYPTA